MGGVDQSLKLYYDRTSGIHLMAIHCTAAERGVFINKMLSYRRDRAAGCVIVFAKSRRLELGDNILRTL